MSARPIIRDIRPQDRGDWQHLWEHYLDFYHARLPTHHTELLWRRLLAADDPVCGVVGESNGSVAGIAHFFPHDDTWERAPVCYLQDLFVAPAFRRGGVATALIADIARRCRDRGWARLHWQTLSDNAPARALYDSIAGGANGFVEYELPFSHSQ